MVQVGFGDLAVTEALLIAQRSLRKALKVSEERGYSQLADHLLKLVKDFGDLPQAWIDELIELQDD